MLAEGDVRIFERTRARDDNEWVVVVFSVPESERDKRHALRASLTRLGYGTAAPAVWIAPGLLARETRQTLERRGLADYVDIFTGQHFAFGDLRAKVPSWWDLDELAQLYADFLARYRPVLYHTTKQRPTPQEAFAIYAPMLTEWRRLPYRDPGLPLSLLPHAWKGEAAGTLFDELNDALAPLAQKHALAVIHGQPQRRPRRTADPS
ncbi:PaaX family transcriptional regulator [Nocardia sp. NBC_00565]|uniref:PaaX family transcriptional regulator n=1 Tax=Nocardia sp. NBC_00565 TaxID=2975993 RepID=UPI002E8157F6|nr:PaaX family transcriptional regulator C-terminal domain-containing protein [Nocardia sp. NBC_00565]WUC06583.1 PaaX family transcriptional regulator [Nocardia sp. NBC_00565]